MILRRFKRIARRYLDAGITVQLFSSPGLGKSESVAQLVEEYSERDGFEWGLVVCMLATYTPSDLLGYLIPGEREVTQADGTVKRVRTSEFTMPPWMISTKGKPINEYNRGIVFFDEYDKADPDVKRGSAEILLNGAVGPWQLHDGIGVIAASNRREDRSGSTKEFDFVINRRGEIHLQADVGSWEDWAVRDGVDPTFITFAKKHPNIVFEGKVPEAQGPFCTPRSLVMLSRLLKGMIDETTGRLTATTQDEEADVLEMASGMIGAPAANQLLVWFKLRTEIPEFDAIIADPAKCEVPTKPDARMMVAYDVAHRITPKTADAAVAYIMRLPREFQMTFGLAACKRNHAIIATPAFQKKFIPEHKSLINLLNS